MASKIVYVTMLLAWMETGPTSDSVGMKAYYTASECNTAAEVFANKHGLHKDDCLRLSYERYMALGEVNFQSDEDLKRIVYYCPPGKRKCRDIK